MKKYLLFAFMLFTNLARTQCYSVSTINYAPDPFVGDSIVNVADDQYSIKIPIGFNFCFYGATYDSLLIGANGLISFNLNLAQMYCQWPIVGAIPTSANPMNTIMLPWVDVNPNMGGTVSYSIYGTSPNRRFVVSFSALVMYGCTTQTVTAQAALYETSYVVDILIQNKPACPSWNGGYAIEGLHNKTGTAAAVVPGRNYPTQWTATNDAKRFTPSCNVCSGVSVNEIKNNEVACSLFPNPSSGIIHVQLKEQGISTICIFNCLGSLIFTEELKNGNSELDLSSFNKGLYFYTISSGNKRSTGRLLIE